MTSIETLNIEHRNEPSSFKLILTLGIAGFISGVVLVGVYFFTKPFIEKNKSEALQTAIFRVVPGAESYKTYKLSGQELVLLEGKPDKSDELIYLGLDKNGKEIAFAIPGAEAGFQDIIAVIYGFDSKTKKVVGFEVLESKETPGLGDKIFKDLAFIENFKSLLVTPHIKPVKKGEKTQENEVECITGATISSKAVVKILNNSISKWEQPIAAYQKTRNE
jgi:Na+-translocating ferredoxin:NAD+ oxidoreductase subunit G